MFTFAGDPSWQAHADEGFDIPNFEIDWSARSAICPNGTFSRTWREGFNRHGNEEIRIAFSDSKCLSCLDRPKCTKSKTAPSRLAHHNKNTRLYRRPVYVRKLINSDALIKFVLAVKVLSLWGYALFPCGKLAILVPVCRLQHILTCFDHLTRTVAWIGGVGRRKTYVSL